MQFFLGVDIGGSKTEALVASESGEVRGYGRSGPGNHQAVGYDGMLGAASAAMAGALRNAGVEPGEIAAAGFGIAGYDWPSQLPAHAEALAPLGLPCAPQIVNDAVIALLAGTPRGWGVAAIAGTSNNCRGRTDDGREGRIVGEGSRFGDHGGGAEMVQRAIQMIAYAWTRRGPPTDLTKAFCDLSGARNADDLIEGIDLARYRPSAGWAHAIFATAAAGDAVACEVIEWSARELAKSACTVARQLELERGAFDLVTGGGIFSGGAIFTDCFKAAVLEVAPHARILQLEVPQAIGGLVLAMQHCHLATEPLYPRLIDSARAAVDRGPPRDA